MIDARGLSCPQPVIKVQKEIKSNSPAEFTVLVDNECAAGNVSRFAENSGYKIQRTDDGDDIKLVLKKDE